MRDGRTREGETDSHGCIAPLAAQLTADQQSLDNLSTAERSDITHLWSTFSSAPHAKRKIILEGILTMCCL
jgi:F-box/WD-40 domain protein MET30